MLQVNNASPFSVDIAVLPDHNGVDHVHAIIKATFDINPALAVADQQIAPVPADVYWREPGKSSLKYASEFHPPKPTTDVVVIGQAWAPNEHAVVELDVRAVVAEREKTVRVFGARTWKRGRVSEPEPFVRMPLVYEYGFGGSLEAGVRRPDVSEPLNPVGRGFCGVRSEGELEGQPLPNIEDPVGLVCDVGDDAHPAGFAFVAPDWQWRRQYAGTYDDVWEAERSPFLPTDFDLRFLNAAHPDFVFDRYLQGGEIVRLENMSRLGVLEFSLPTCEFDVTVTIDDNVETPTPQLETVLVEPEENRLCMTWRGVVPCEKQTLKVEQVSVESRNVMLHPNGA